MAKLSWLQREIIVSPYLILCGSEDEYFAAMKYLKIKYPDEWLTPGYNAKLHTSTNKNNVACVVCADFKELAKESLPVICGLLIHEAVHVWHDLCNNIGEKNPSTEFECYSIQAIAQRLISDFMERGKWKRSKN